MGPIRWRLPAWTNSRAGGAALTVVVLLGALGAAVGAGYSVSRPFLSDGSAYLAKGHTVAHVNGETGRSDAEVARQLATGKEAIEPVRLPDGRLAIVNHATGTVEFVDTSTMTPNGAPVRRPDSKGEVKAISAASHGYLVDQKRDTVEQLATPGQPAPAAVPVPEGIEAAVPAGDSAWVLTRAGVVLEVAGDRVVRTVRVGEPQVGLTIADGHPVAVTESGTAWVVDEAQPRRIGDLQAPGRRFALGSWQGSDRYAVGVDTTTGRVVALDPRTGRRITVDLKVTPGRADLGAPVVLGSRVFVPDKSGPRLWQVDLASGKADGKALAVPGPAGKDFELKVSGGRVWANSQYDRRALVVDGNGHERYADKGPAPELNDSQAKDDSPAQDGPSGGPPAAPQPAAPAVPAGPTQPPRRSVTVPDIKRGMPYEEACDRLREAGLRCSPVAVGDADGLRTGDVVDTTPAAGRKVLQGSRVVVRYAGPLRVPDVSGLPYKEACAQVKAAGLTCTATAETGVANSPDQLEAVTAQDPAAGAQVDRGSVVTVRYPTAIALPSFAGLSQGEACARLKAYKMGCRATAGLPATGGGKTPGQVYEQAPAAGTQTQAHTTVTVTFYSGENQVGTYTGMSSQEACAKVAADGFACNAVEGKSPAGTGQQPGTVYAQDPPPGGQQDIGKPVTVTHYSNVGLELPDYTGQNVNDACNAIQAKGYACNAVPDLFPSTNVVGAQDKTGGPYPLGIAVTVHYSPWKAVRYFIYKHNQEPVWVLRQEGDIPPGYGAEAYPVGAAYDYGTQIPTPYAVNGFFCTDCDGLPVNHFASHSGEPLSGWNGPNPLATFMRCEGRPGQREIFRTWTAGADKRYNITANPAGAAGSESLGCVWG